MMKYLVCLLFVGLLAAPSWQQSMDQTCQLKPETGPCKALFYRFHYNVDTKKCERFIYGGCGGNGNNFLNIAECETNCHGF
ncbi:kappaPI-actitoxin-Avd3a-like [Haliotis asinina]|uniref:kappaPI-actitoxin-Avd3a-like n=1 Tax=Haliotis asinina TaxID=109174 RepID=UPI003531B3D4